MGRRLPWVTNTTTLKKKTIARAESPAISQHDIAAGSSKSSVVHNAGEVTTPPTKRKRAFSRTPSTSPPPGPPPVLPLRTGYDNDDLFIMVEDEFYSVAQSYTAHLHHAEYKRLMRKAKEAPPRKIADLSPSKPRNVRDRVRRDILRDKQQSALDDTIGRGGNRITDAEEDDDECDADTLNQKRDKPARFGGLTGLMQAEGQAKTSLVGLQRLPSSTRAALGYSNASNNTKSHGNLSRKDRSTKEIEDFFPGKKGIGQRQVTADRYGDRSEVSRRLATEDEQSNVWSREQNSKAGQHRRQRGEVDTSHANMISTRTTQRRRGISTSKSTKPANNTSTTKRSLIDDLEEGLEDEYDYNYDLEDLTVHDKRHAISSSLSPPSSRVSHKPITKVKVNSTRSTKTVQKDKKSRLDEVPVFMF